MAENGDKKTLGLSGEGMRVNNSTLLLTLDREILNYLGVSYEDVVEGKVKLILQFDHSDKHKWNFIGIGIKK
jgi:hypothetical protein